MPTANSVLPADWFARGDQDIRAAEILLTQNGPLPMAAFHIQQAIEKYLKGFLLSTGWALRRIHDLEILIQETIARDSDFTPHLSPCQKITEYYLETRYPHGFSTELQKEVLEADLNVARTLIELIQKKASP